MIDSLLFIERIIRLANLIVAAEDRPIKYGTEYQLTRTEIHTIEAIGDHPGLSVTELARLRGISKSAVSQLLLRLKAKKLVMQKFLEGSDRDTSLALTTSGGIAYKQHRATHHQLYKMIQERLDTYSPEFFDELAKLIDEVETQISEKDDC